MSCAETIDLPCHTLGDSYLGLAGFGPILIDAVQPSDPLTRVTMIFNKQGTTFTLDTEAGADFLMVITDEDTWEVTVGTIAEFLPSGGSWSWEADFYSDYFGEKLTLYTGELIV
jgi:hypothetical protein